MLDHTNEMNRTGRNTLAARRAMSSGSILAALALVACGGGGSGSSTSASTTMLVSASAGATLAAGAATLTIPAGALAQDTQLTLREAEPHHAGRAARIEVEPHDALVAGHDALLSVEVDNANPKVMMHDGSDDALQDVEVEDRNHHSFKTAMTTLGDVEVEVEDGLSCATPCATGQECDDGVCQDHNGGAATCADVCSTGEECDDGVCKTHDQVESEHGGAPGTCTPTCASPLVCHDGVCSAHG